MIIMLFKKLSDVSEAEMQRLISRGSGLADVGDTVSAVLSDVRMKGDAALREYTKKFDKVELANFEVSEEEFEKALSEIGSELLGHLRIAAENIRAFHRAQMPETTWFMELQPGVVLGQKATPLESVGAYAPGGRASYPSTVLMTVIPARVAGVEQVIVCTPPRADGSVHPLTLAAAKVAGADKVFKLGGVQAIGAMAYGTETVPRVDKIVGPGNVFVTSAKMQVRDIAEIDFPAGPSEVLIIADESADAAMAASDIIAQAEHDPNAVSMLVTTSETLAEEVEQEVLAQAESTARSEIVKISLENAAVLIADSLDQCIDFSNKFAPEHLEIMVEDSDFVLGRIKNAGSIFIGNYAPVPVGDYASGTNHVLPTAGYAKIYSGLNINHFLKYSSIQKISKSGLESLKETVIALAEEEGLKAHADSIRARFGYRPSK
ncbi:histidinol dehydrogenase [Methanosarcina mazei]|jgi:histidinol dehydrogenase|uniref:Histidinol dehydrogenase n=4 Tax=Methanosarcina mazei TaxID=2209 RepID=A0A0F8MCL0_METMZ|nr:histidinol dehydrogenase [Methanosarcina mazei]KKG00615.1 histidinol dehydrogenase [Methanosarcina mazei]KKG05464.1 histidinol dehydrogenase [Methanosarcina mazei]KKG06548.1 histidinol dehydrogenase [Methanosarcina mazei]KKG14934.1 histidinol dehydrogenase [Methanosarcina mazei]KKG29290.1 histidinol dehydrogenase [Methanosarcina mazei]